MIAGCPVCGEQPEVTEFAVNPILGGGTAYECACPNCGFNTDYQWRTEADAIADWNEYITRYYFDPDWEEDEQ